MKNRKTQKHTAKIGIAKTQQAAVAITGLRVEVIKALKSAGVQRPFNANGTIDCDALVAAAKEHEDLVKALTTIPDISIEEAFEKQADRRRKEVLLLKLTGAVVPKDQPRRAFTAVAKIFLGRLYALEDRFHLAFKIPREEIRKELDNVAAPLSAEEFDRLMSEASKNES